MNRDHLNRRNSAELKRRGMRFLGLWLRILAGVSLLNGFVAQSADLRLTLTAEKESFHEGEPVFVRLMIENKGTNDANVTLGLCSLLL